VGLALMITERFRLPAAQDPPWSWSHSAAGPGPGAGPCPGPVGGL